MLNFNESTITALTTRNFLPTFWASIEVANVDSAFSVSPYLIYIAILHDEEVQIYNDIGRVYRWLLTSRVIPV